MKENQRLITIKPWGDNYELKILGTPEFIRPIMGNRFEDLSLGLSKTLRTYQISNKWKVNAMLKEYVLEIDESIELNPTQKDVLECIVNFHNLIMNSKI